MPANSCGATRAHPGLSEQMAARYLCFLCSYRGSRSPGIRGENLISWTAAAAPRHNTNCTAKKLQNECCPGKISSKFFRSEANDTLAEWSRRWPAKPMGTPRVGSNPTGVVCPIDLKSHPNSKPNSSSGKCVSPYRTLSAEHLQHDTET